VALNPDDRPASVEVLGPGAGAMGGHGRCEGIRRSGGPEFEARLAALRREHEAGMARALAGEALWPFKADYDDRTDGVMIVLLPLRSSVRTDSRGANRVVDHDRRGRPVCVALLRVSEGITLAGVPQRATIRAALEQLAAEGRLPAGAGIR
jgi:hypothetical protein